MKSKVEKTALTERELQVTRMVLASKTTGDIARILNIAEGTVGAHLSKIYAFYGVDNRVGLLSHIYATPELRHTLITAAIAMTDTSTPTALQARGLISMVAERNAPDLSIRLGDASPFSYPLSVELLNASMDRHVPHIVREGPTIWAGFLQGDMRFVIDRVAAIAPPIAPHHDESGETVVNHGLNVAATRMTAWLYALRAAALALCGSERQQSDAMTAAEAAGAFVASSQLLPWTMRVTRIFVYACSTRSAAGLERLLQLADEIESLNPVRIYVLTLAVRLAQHLGPAQRTTQKSAMDLFAAEALAVREEIQRRASNTVFNVKSDQVANFLGSGWRRTDDGRYAHQCLVGDDALDLYLMLEVQILREVLDYSKVVLDYPDYREKLKLAHAKLRLQRGNNHER